MSTDSYHIELTVADHEANGFIGLVRWQIGSEDQGRAILAEIDQEIPDEAAGDLKTDPYIFILDLRDPDDMILDNNAKCLPLQMAMRLAPDRVGWWLKERPDPNRLVHEWSPVIPGLPILSV